ncbi:MAG: hypothetical protein EZS28_044349 [Streblomastix strix]|uniref:Uncharacterized protein n=1 Tax=Streblomastix strix TaxID=222440 RepID=A0A5J4TRY8_9EUKA|nr:MAG: hypothetical protein EZS28_044349 [Streblomastix strix]
MQQNEGQLLLANLWTWAQKGNQQSQIEERKLHMLILLKWLKTNRSFYQTGSNLDTNARKEAPNDDNIYLVTSYNIDATQYRVLGRLANSFISLNLTSESIRETNCQSQGAQIRLTAVEQENRDQNQEENPISHQNQLKKIRGNRQKLSDQYWKARNSDQQALDETIQLTKRISDYAA